MRKEQGITVIVLILTIMILTMLAGLIITNAQNTYEKTRVVQFTSYMKMIQKKLDYYIEAETDCTTLGRPLNETIKKRLQKIIDKHLIDTSNVDSTKLRYFNGKDIYEYFDITDVEDEIVVNFENREVISLNGVEKDGKTYYVEKGL